MSLATHTSMGTQCKHFPLGPWWHLQKERKSNFVVRNFISANKIKYWVEFISVILNAHICSFFPRGILPSSLDRNWSTSSSTTLMLALSPVAPKLVKLVVLAFLLPTKLLRLAVLAGLVDKMPPESPVSIAVAKEPPVPAVKYIWSPCLSKIKERN